MYSYVTLLCKIMPRIMNVTVVGKKIMRRLGNDYPYMLVTMSEVIFKTISITTRSTCTFIVGVSVADPVGAGEGS